MVFQNKCMSWKWLRGTGGGPAKSHREYYVGEGFSGSPLELKPEFSRTARGRAKLLGAYVSRLLLPCGHSLVQYWKLPELRRLGTGSRFAPTWYSGVLQFLARPRDGGGDGARCPAQEVYTVLDRRCAVGGREMELVLCRFATHRRGFPEPVYIRLRLVTFLFRISRPRAVDSSGGRPAPPGRPPCFYLSRACPVRSRPTILSNCPPRGGKKRL